MFGVKARTHFDHARVSKASKSGEQLALEKFGAYVWKIARNSISTRKRVSDPGKPPHSPTRILKTSIRFGYDEHTRSVVIGPVRLDRSTGEAPRALEEGGTSTIKTISGRKKITKLAYIRKRPFMHPAFEKGLPKAASQFKDSMRGP